MSILNINITDIDLAERFPEYVEYNPELKDEYGEINTPYRFIMNEMLSTIPLEQFKNKHLKWLDAGSGRGNFSLCLFIMLFTELVTSIPNAEERKAHIIHNMIYMVEINQDNVLHLREKFGEKANIYHEDYLEWNTDIRFDFIIGNPPYNCHGVKKVPTNTETDKKNDGKTIWPEFVKKNISLLKEDGMMSIIIPSIWLKPDKAGIYNLLLQYDIEKLTTLNASQVMKTFNNQAQTPLCYFLLTKRENTGKIEIYDQITKGYVEFILHTQIPMPIPSPIQMPIPLCFVSIVNKFLVMREKYGKLHVIKTNMPPKGTILKDNFSFDYPFQNVHTTTINKLTKQPTLHFRYSNEELAFCGEPKLIMAHKMYGFPYLDKDGSYGISTRDNYIIKNKDVPDLALIKEFLSTKLILFLFETTRYRMRYLEKYVFEYIPDFSKIPEAIGMYEDRNIDIYKLFGITKEEEEFIERYYKIKYKFFE